MEKAIFCYFCTLADASSHYPNAYVSNDSPKTVSFVQRFSRGKTSQSESVCVYTEITIEQLHDHYPALATKLPHYAQSAITIITARDDSMLDLARRPQA